jgi:predicted nicotinamide N-methyase
MTKLAGTALSSVLRERFSTRVVPFTHGDFKADMLLPEAAEDLIDEREFDTDERLPYWAELWPSAQALARYLLDQPLTQGPTLELGAGVALPSLVLRWRGEEVLATDYYADALLFAEANAASLDLMLPTRLVDWRIPPPELERWPFVIAADVLYERRNADALFSVLPHVLAPGGEALIADPGRVYLRDFLALAEEAGWHAEQVAEREEGASSVQLWKLSAGASGDICSAWSLSTR